MCHHELWPTSVSHPFSSLNISFGFAGGKPYQKIVVTIFRHGLQNFAIPGYFPFIISPVSEGYVCPSIGLLTTFSGFCTFADKSLGRNGIELEMQMFPDDLPLANIDADGYCCHFMRSSVRPTIHGLGFVYCIQSARKKWPTIWHADVSRWLTLSIHGCLWILLLVCLSVHLSVCSFTAFSGGCAFADKSLGTNGIKFDMLMYLLV